MEQASTRPQLTVYGVLHEQMGIDAFTSAVDGVAVVDSVFCESTGVEPHTELSKETFTRGPFLEAAREVMGVDTITSIDGSGIMYPELAGTFDRVNELVDQFMQGFMQGDDVSALLQAAPDAYEANMQAILERDSIMAGQIAWHEFNNASVVVGALHGSIGPLVEKLLPDVETSTVMAAPTVTRNVLKGYRDQLEMFVAGQTVEPINLVTLDMLAHFVLNVSESEYTDGVNIEDPEFVASMPGEITDDVLEQFRSIATSSHYRSGIDSSEYGGPEHAKRTLHALSESTR